MKNVTAGILQDAINKLAICHSVVESVAKDELENAEKLPGNLKASQKYGKMKVAADNLRIAASQVLNAITLIEDACETGMQN